MFIRGKIVRGMGEGARFLAMPKYKEGFVRVLGFRPFEGTLNIDISIEDIEKIDKMREGRGLTVDGFLEGETEFYKIICYRAKIKEHEGAIVFPLLTHHPKNILEFVCSHNLREELAIKDGSYVELEI